MAGYTPMIATSNNMLSDVKCKLDHRVPLSFDDGMWLYQSADLHTLGELADTLRRRLHGNDAYYNINRHVNYSNYCVLRCKFCSFYRPYTKKPGTNTAREGGYELSVATVAARAAEAYAQGATEVHIVGGLHPQLPFDYYLNMCRTIREACPHMHIKAFTAIEIIHFTRIAKPRRSIQQVLEQLVDAGLGSLPGGGAEIFDDRVHEEAFQTKVGEAEWFDVHRAAHELGIFTNATMLYGHVETPADRVRHLMKLREHQEASLQSRKAHFNTVIPLSFIPNGSELAHLPGPGGLDDLRTLAMARLMCHNIPHIKSFWIMHSPKLAQVSLAWGVDDLDGTVVYYDITKRDQNAGTHQELSIDAMRRMIAETGCRPVERDTLYRTVIRKESSWQIEGQPWSVAYRGVRDEPAQPTATAPIQLNGPSRSHNRANAALPQTQPRRIEPQP